MSNATTCSLFVPYKSWHTDPRERANYEAIERWGRDLIAGFTPGSNVHNLHIPNKGFAGNALELENYLAIERWARRFQVNCIKTCVCG